MSGLQYLDALATERAHAATMRRVIFVVAALGAVGIWFASTVPKNIDLHLAPDVKAGDTVRVKGGEAPVPPTNVYGFAYYIWQQINRWQTDGSKDYGQQIFNFQAYLTPRCQAQLTADMEARQRAGELQLRTRQVSEIPGFSFASNRVVDEGSFAWTALLDMQVTETFRGQPVKDVFIRYPVRVVRYDVDRERNPWRLALDCFGSNQPARLNESDLRESRTKRPTVPALPSNVNPSALPEAVPLERASAASPKPQATR
ncbi:TIGR03746 family integrating conjugative element protein [Variovorax sp. ZS18.2.2]|uniref:PFL_4703 family integrating conjugative element protein n=1 Tax=Variovorax sp. ZS18.2.2 TaxID=2971255 RepID=UPI002151F009|nr:TIGR03746 family integrating conjugative element protein [Variovorax sp. ZS18.2.2]MCR6480987.1 TIGR03746 family integrating conjugative element protein [Variovorax sp. ZS18.2.2]